MRIPDWRWLLKWRILYPIIHGHSYMKDYEIDVRNTLLQVHGDSFWDVGANTGYYSILLSRNFKHVRAFEPDPLSVAIMKRKIARRRIGNILVSEVALADKPGTSELYLHSKIRKSSIGSSNTLMTQEAGKGEPKLGVPSVNVAVQTVDQTLGSGTLDLVKVDVEGAEFLVLEGAAAALKEGRIKNLMIELHDAKRKDELDRILTANGYQTSWLDFTAASATSHVFARLQPAS